MSFQGVNGPIGLPGMRGIPGVEGDDGEAGPTGQAGRFGDPGAEGQAGEKGPMGEPGQAVSFYSYPRLENFCFKLKNFMVKFCVHRNDLQKNFEKS